MNAINRRSLLLAGLGAASTGVLTAHAGSVHPGTLSRAGLSAASAPGGDRGSAERTVAITATPGPVDLGGLTVDTWTFGGRLPGEEIRLTAGETLTAQFTSGVSAPTSVHWHGVTLSNDMDGVPPITMNYVKDGGSFTYRFVAGIPGTYWYHPHVGVQTDRGLYGALIVQDPHEPLDYDDEWVVFLDDWLDGVTGTPDDVFTALTGRRADGDDGGSMPRSPAAGQQDGGQTGELLRDGDIYYPYHLINGRLPTDPAVYQAKPGTRVRLRIINAGADTAYRLALGGHTMTITHTDGHPVQHEEVDALVLGMGERYDVLVTLQDGVFPLVAVAAGKGATGMALVRTGAGEAPSPTFRPPELRRRLLNADQLRAADRVQLAYRAPDVTHRIRLTGTMAKFDWALNGRPFDMHNADADPFLVGQGQRVRLEFINMTRMWHPMHLHGHTFRLGDNGPLKDTTIVLPRSRVRCDFDANSPGRWLVHCHNTYHSEAGMMGLVAYTH